MNNSFFVVFAFFFLMSCQGNQEEYDWEDDYYDEFDEEVENSSKFELKFKDKGLSCDDYYTTLAGYNIKNRITYGERLYFNFNDIRGFELKDGARLIVECRACPSDSYQWTNCVSFDLTGVDMQGFIDGCAVSKKPATTIAVSVKPYRTANFLQRPPRGRSHNFFCCFSEHVRMYALHFQSISSKPTSHRWASCAWLPFVERRQFHGRRCRNLVCWCARFIHISPIECCRL